MCTWEKNNDVFLSGLGFFISFLYDFFKFVGREC